MQGIQAPDLFFGKDIEPPTSVLDTLLTSSIKNFHIEYAPASSKAPHFANHLFQGLCSLYLLGASASALREWYSYYSTEHFLVKTIPSIDAINNHNWLKLLGTHHYFADYYVFYSKRMAAYKSGNLKPFLKDTLPFILQGCLGSDFHPLISLALGFECKHLDMILNSMASMSYSYLSFQTPLSDKVMKQKGMKNYCPAKILKKMQNDPRLDEIQYELFERRNYTFTRKMRIFKNVIDVYCILENYDLNFEKLENKFGYDFQKIYKFLFNFIMKTYFHKIDFFWSHIIVALRSLKTILNETYGEDKDFETKKFFLKIFWRNLVVIYFLRGRKEFEEKDMKSLTQAEEIIERKRNRMKREIEEKVSRERDAMERNQKERKEEELIAEEINSQMRSKEKEIELKRIIKEEKNNFLGKIVDAPLVVEKKNTKKAKKKQKLFDTVAKGRRHDFLDMAALNLDSQLEANKIDYWMAMNGAKHQNMVDEPKVINFGAQPDVIHVGCVGRGEREHDDKKLEWEDVLRDIVKCRDIHLFGLAWVCDYESRGNPNTEEVAFYRAVCGKALIHYQSRASQWF